VVKVCVIGLGPIGNLHADLHKRDEMVDLAGVCDIESERAETTGRRLGVRWFTDAREMLRVVKPQVVSVATGGYEYGSDHALPTLLALEAGCHVLCEKPISNELEPARAMVAKAREKRLCLGVDFNHRFTPVARQAKKWQSEGLLGDLLFCNMALWIGKFQPLESRYYHLKALNPHSIDMMRYYCGEISRVQLFAMTAPGRNIWSTASFNMQFESGAVGHLTSSYDIERGHPMERCEVAGTKGRLVVEDMWREATFYPAGNLEKRVFTNPVFGGYTGFDDTFRERLRCFVRQVAAGARPEEIDGSGEDALKGLQVILAAIRSLDTGQVVEVASL
jgi:predicted dehydrogenase